MPEGVTGHLLQYHSEFRMPKYGTNTDADSSVKSEHGRGLTEPHVHEPSPVFLAFHLPLLVVLGMLPTFNISQSTFKPGGQRRGGNSGDRRKHCAERAAMLISQQP